MQFKDIPLHTARLVFFTALLGSAALQAAPLDSRSRPMATPDAPAPAGRADTAQAAKFRAGVQAQLKGDQAQARLHFEAALKIDAQYAPALLGLASVAQAQGQTAQVEPYLQQALAAAPKAPEVHLAWGRYFRGSRQLDRAEKSLVTANELAPKALAPLIELGDLYLVLPGRAPDAVGSYRRAAAIDAKSAVVQYGLGAALAVTGQRDEALRAFERTAELAPNDPTPLRSIGRLHLEAGAAAKALAALDRGLARQPKAVAIMLDRSDALAQLARWPDALNQLAAVDKLAPGQPDVQLKLGDVLQGAGRWADAERSYLKTIELAPRNPMAYNNLAWMTVARQGDAKKAVEWARRAVELSPGSSPFHDTLGWAERAAGNLAGAQVSLGKAIELEPRVAAYHLHLGTVQAELKQTAAARASLQRSIELNPGAAEATQAKTLLKSLQGP